MRRLCCGQPHDDVVCPDGLVMCCVCFDRVTIDELEPSPVPGHPPYDVCKGCAVTEMSP
jgi:hypothetical protein